MATQEAIAAGQSVVSNLSQHRVVEDTAEKMGFESRAAMLQVVRVIGAAMIMLGILVVILNQVFTIDSISNSSGPFSDVITDVETIGGAALGLLVIGMLALAGNRIMGMFGGGGGF